jgi:4-amino-4-deoxy-L-arabinose transferase-like glycosyltransferase
MNARSVSSHLAPLALILLTLVLRIWSLGAFSVTHDEAYGLWVATRPLADVLPATARDVHPPLYYLLLHGWLAFGPHSDAWARLLSALLGTALVPALYALGRRLWGTYAGLAAALLIALSPLAVAQAREARMYLLAVLLLALAAYALLRATEERRLRWWAAYIALSALALYTHYYASFVLVAFTLYALRTTLHASRLHLASCILHSVAIGVLFLPWLPALVDQFTRVRAGFWIPPPSPEAVGKVAQALSFFAVTPRPSTATPGDFAVKVVGAGCVAAALFAACVASGRRRLLLPALWLVAPLVLAYAVSLLGPSIFEPRYFAVCLPAFVLLVARGMVALPGRLPKIVLLTGLVVASLASLFTFATFSAYRPPDARSAAAWLREHAASSGLVVHTDQVSLRPTVWYNGDDAAGVLTDDPALPARLTAASRVVLVVPYDVRLAAGPRHADTTAAKWAAQHDLWDLRTVARFYGIHIYVYNPAS